jgi:hypothetical protein
MDATQQLRMQEAVRAHIIAAAMEQKFLYAPNQYTTIQSAEQSII